MEKINPRRRSRSEIMFASVPQGGGRVVRWCWVNFQCRGVLQFGWWGCLDIFTLIYPLFPFSPSLWETARYRLKYCLKGPLNPKQPNNQLSRKTCVNQRLLFGK